MVFFSLAKVSWRFFLESIYMFSFGVCVFFVGMIVKKRSPSIFSVTASLIRSELQKLHSRFHSSANQKKKEVGTSGRRFDFETSLQRGPLVSKFRFRKPDRKKKLEIAPKKKTKIGPAKLLESYKMKIKESYL